MPSREIELPNGQIGEFPDTMGNAEIESVLRRQFPSQQSAAPQPQQTPENMQSHLQQMQGSGRNPMDNLRFLGTEVGAAGNAAAGMLNPLTYVNAFRNPATPQEMQRYGSTDFPSLNRIGVGLGRLTAEPITNLTQQAKQAWTQNDPKAAANVIGSLGGMAVGGKTLSAIPGAAMDATTYAKIRSMGWKAVTHDLLNKTADAAQKKLQDVHATVSDRVGGLKADLVNRDYADGGNKIPTTSITPLTDQIGQNYSPAGMPLSRFDAAAKLISNIQDPYISLEQALDLRTAVGTLMSKTVKGTRDSAAMGELYQRVHQLVSDRVGDLGMSKQFRDYNGVWSTMMKYEQDSSPLGKLLAAQDGQSFFRELYDPKNTQQLRRINDSLNDYGLDKDYFNKLGKDHAEGYKSVATPQGFGGKLSSFMRRPVAAISGATVGAAAGSVLPGAGHMLGAIAGAGLGAKFADAMKASRYVREQGGAPSTVGEMKPFTSQPSGVGVQRPAAPANPQMLSQLTKDMQSLGYDKAEAGRRAAAGVAAYPNDLQKATDAAIRGDQPPKSVSGGSQSAPAAEPEEQYTSGFANKAKQVQQIKSQRSDEPEGAWKMPSPTEDLVKAVRQAQDAGTKKEYFAKQLTRYMYPANASKITPELVDKAWALEQAVRKSKRR